MEFLCCLYCCYDIINSYRSILVFLMKKSVESASKAKQIWLSWLSWLSLPSVLICPPLPPRLQKIVSLPHSHDCPRLLYWQAYGCASSTVLQLVRGLHPPNLLAVWLCIYHLIVWLHPIHSSLYIHYSSCQLTQDFWPWANIMCFLSFVMKYYISCYIIQSVSVLHLSH